MLCSYFKLRKSINRMCFCEVLSPHFRLRATRLRDGLQYLSDRVSNAGHLLQPEPSCLRGYIRVAVHMQPRADTRLGVCSALPLNKHLYKIF
jgi:hypothetical protein